MFLIDRGAIAIKAKEPFVTWLNQLPDNEPDMKFDLINVNQDGYLFLVPEFEDNAQVERWIKRNAGDLFEMILDDWCTEPNWWPQDRNFKVFEDWFSWELFSSPMDLMEEEITKDDL
jgi:hypothetical protein